MDENARTGMDGMGVVPKPHPVAGVDPIMRPARGPEEGEEGEEEEEEEEAEEEEEEET